LQTCRYYGISRQCYYTWLRRFDAEGPEGLRDRPTLDKGLQPVYIKPLSPRLNGKVERSHRIDAEEFYRLLNGVVIDDSQTFADELREWEDYYNYHRPHGGSAGRHPMRGSARRPQPRPRRNQPPSVAHLDE
jgi:transposase InsO family protein